MLDVKTILLIALSVLTTAEVVAERAWPNTVFDCQVVTDSGSTGLVGLQTFSLKDAEEGVVGLTATTLLGNSRECRSCCAVRGAGSAEKSFRDQNFQAWVNALPR